MYLKYRMHKSENAFYSIKGINILWNSNFTFCRKLEIVLKALFIEARPK